MKTLSSSLVACARLASPSAGRPCPATTNGRLALEIVLRDRPDQESYDKRMRKERGDGALPPPLSLGRNSDRRPIALLYVDGAASFGETPMTLTPAPRATSIAKITSEYLTFGSPFTKMIFSGRPV